MFFFSSRRRHTICALVTGVQTCALPICLEANDIVDTATHQVATQEDLLALLDANLGVAIIPDGASATNGFRRIPLMRLELARTVSAYTVAGRPRAVACATLLNLLRAADWRFDAGTAQQGRAH